MKQVPEIHTLLHESLLYSYVPSSSAFGEEKGKIRSSSSVRIYTCFIMTKVKLNRIYTFPRRNPLQELSIVITKEKSAFLHT